MVTVEEHRIRVETRTLSAVLERGWLTSLVDRANGEQLLVPFDASEESAVQLVYRGDERVRLDGVRAGEVRCRQLSPHRAEVVFHSWDGDGVLLVTEDADSGDLVIEPSAHAGRPGVLACRWTAKGLRPDLELVAPLWQGVKLAVDDPINKNARWRWPSHWEAGLVILQGQKGGLWVHTRDDRYRYKALKFGGSSDPRAVSLDAEAYGPVDGNLSAGGLAWRVNVFQGDWHAPAAVYRDWLWKAYGLHEAPSRRPEWLRRLGMAISWCPADPELLDALARKVEPGRVLLHVPHWRTDPYDQNYPTFEASEAGRAFIAKAQAMGFHVAPHFNSVDMDPSHPVYALVGDFQYRDVETGRLHGWAYEKGQVLSVPGSNAALAANRRRNVMVKIHPGLATWRSVLGEAVQRAAEELALDTVFLDVTLTSSNLRNCFADGMTSTEGMKRLIEHVSALGEGLTVGGEGLNEITMQGLSFAQAHLYGYGSVAEGVERTGGCALNHFLFGDLCRTIGYAMLSGKTEAEVLRMRLHEEHGAIPTITVHSAQEILDPNPAVRQVLDRAAAGAASGP
jgi:hypothetical protein